MDTTPLGFPYPECDPPEVKDLSDIGQLHAFAESVNTYMSDLDEDVTNNLTDPPYARLIMSAAVATTANTAIPTFDTVSFTNVAPMFQPGGIQAPRPGWYLCGTYTVVTPTGGPFEFRTQLLRNGAEATGYGTGSRTVFSLPYQSQVLLLNPGDIVGVRIRHDDGTSPNWTYQTRLWAVRLVAV